MITLIFPFLGPADYGLCGYLCPVATSGAPFYFLFLPHIIAGGATSFILWIVFIIHPTTRSKPECVPGSP